MIDTVVVPHLWLQTGWLRTTRSDGAVRALRNRHYSTLGKNGRTVGPPGRVLILRTADGLASWITHWPARELAMDGLDAWRCSMFRNEGARRSSDLIVEAMRETRDAWGTVDEWGEPAPRDGWLTYVEPLAVRSPNPGYCFRMAGWTRDRDWDHSRLIRLRAEAAA